MAWRKATAVRRPGMMNRFKTNRIARMVCSAHRTNIDKGVLDFCEGKLLEIASERGFANARTIMHDGSSSDGYISFTEGDVSCLIAVDGYGLLEIAEGKYFSEWQDACMENFWIENHSLTDGVVVDGVGRIDNLPFGKLANLLKDGLLDEEIEGQYSKYETEWMSGQYGYLVVEIQFRNDGEGDNPRNYTSVIYAYLCDNQMKQKKYLHQDSFTLNEDEVDFRSAIEKRIETAFEAISK